MLSAEKKNKFIVITSINSLNVALKTFASMEKWKMILVGDRKGPKEIKDERIIFLNLKRQKELDLIYPSICPENHYSRKNIGYLYAIINHADIIAESDDDNIPKNGWGKDIKFRHDNLDVFENTTFFNIYSEFTKLNIWPRGYPLENILSPVIKKCVQKSVDIGIIQQLADKNADVDAIYRLTRNEHVKFNDRSMFALGKHVYCPFNSQNTFWTREAFPFMYLPQTVSFRFTDILRGYIAQRLLWEDNLYLGFGPASVVQERNPHNLLHDFISEIPMYTKVNRLVEILESVKLKGSSLENLCYIYEQLYKSQIVDKPDLIGVKKWKNDLSRFGFQ